MSIPIVLFNSNWSSLKRVLDLILRLAREDGAESRSRINDWIAEQADSIIIKEMKRTKSAFVASHDLTPEVLASDYIDARLDAIAEDNPLISGRVRTLLSQCGDPPPAEPINRDKDPTASTDVEMEEATPENGSDPGQEQEPGHERKRIEFVSVSDHGSAGYRSELTPKTSTRWPQLYCSVMGQIAFACNRRNNAMQHRNGLMTLACGANDRLTMFLYDCGLTISRWATLQAAASLTKANSTKLKEIGSNKYFHVTVHNIDVTHHVNDRQLDRRTELLHRTFGYAHIQNGDIADAYNLRAYSAHQASLPRVNLQHLLPTPQSDSSSTTGIKAQIYRALARLVPHLGLSLLDAHHPPVLVIDGQLDALSKGLVRDQLCPICIVDMHFRRLYTQQTGRKINTCGLHSNRSVISIPVPKLIEFEKGSNGLDLHRPRGRVLVKTFAQNHFDLLA
ncbi:BZ3500_MvSof-1268-A1-R1_Chr4-2g06887 [Microbotryum saponariae]|uniref:BZ3500_MvSof-1268-A1-R1_Chr4-2g06887 protein n=1 Tax=Microbotryum saponariae TaxID=289078 RepID=A0A2X0KST8_9BASI|nr:BZ3500_MvSof-1268-A1-R1_Chr4-2g06887 [Microbotryum saponariae]SDA06552.1 BZ3501_MvSof-1269-A2-R1_Chr4-2g06598 [Microbotryum saponariae]